jgi:hypothetical protein
MEINGAASTISPGVRRSRLRQRMIEHVEKVGFYGRLLTGGSMHTEARSFGARNRAVEPLTIQ